MDIPAEDLERARETVDNVRRHLADVVARLPYDADMAVDFIITGETGE